MLIPAAVMQYAEASDDESCPAAGFLDQSSNSEKIVCGENENLGRSANVDFSDNDRFNVYAHALSNGAVWTIEIEHHDSDTEKSCTTTIPAGTCMKKLLIGSETSRPHNPDYEHEWDDLEIGHQDVGSDVSVSVWIDEEGSGYDVEECGSGDERYRYNQTSKGDISQC